VADPPATSAGRAAGSHFAGAVLAGGASSRMGRDKAVIDVAGRPMVVRVLDALRGAGAADTAVIGGDAGALERLGLMVVPDGWPGRGPLGGILTAFAWSPQPIVAVLACDLAFLVPDVIADLHGALQGLRQEAGRQADVAMAVTDRREPLCAMWRIPSCEPALIEAFTAGERAVHRALGALNVVEVAVAPARLRNVNTETELGGLDAPSPGQTA
jgi:molybdenum cofactor guanylyltransferase